MVQEQLVDYVSSQMKLGVSRDAIKSALVSAGWVAGDVEDTLKKVEGAAAGGGASASVSAVGRPATMPQGQSAFKVSSPMTASSSSSPATAKTGEPQMIRVSDLVSSSPSSGVSVAATGSTAAKSNKDQLFGGKISGNTFEAKPITASTMPAGGGNKKMLIGGVVAVVLILLFGGAAGYFYSSNASLASQVTSLTSQSASVTAELSTLKSQVDASTTGLAAQVATLTTANENLALNLSFYVVPPDESSSTVGTALPITVSGSLSDGGKAPYAITTAQGAKIFVANSSDATVSSELKPLVGETIQLQGTYVPGSDQMTVTSVSTSTTQ